MEKTSFRSAIMIHFNNTLYDNINNRLHFNFMILNLFEEPKFKLRSSMAITCHYRRMGADNWERIDFLKAIM